MAPIVSLDHARDAEIKRLDDLLQSLPVLNTTPIKSRFNLDWWEPYLDGIRDRVDVERLRRHLTVGVSPPFKTTDGAIPNVRNQRTSSWTPAQTLAGQQQIII